MRVLWICWSRTGSTWASHCLAEMAGYLWSDDTQAADDAILSRTHGTVFKVKERPWLKGAKKVLGIRDPRDVVVSSYYMLLRNADFTVETLSIADFIELSISKRFVRYRTPSVNAYPCSLRQFYDEWLQEGVDVKVRHEDLIADRAGELARIAHALELPVVADVNEIVAKAEGHTRAVYDDDYTRRVDTGTVPRGLHSWQQYLGERELGMLYEHCGGLMHYCGYEW